jgi:hypothetical protein
MVSIVKIVKSLRIERILKRLLFVYVCTWTYVLDLLLNDKSHVTMRKANIFVHQHPVMISRVKSVTVLESKLLIFDYLVSTIEVVTCKAFKTAANDWDSGDTITLDNELTCMIPKYLMIFLDLKHLILQIVFDTPGKH